MPIPEGTLVRVKDSALAHGAEHLGMNRRGVAAHGYLYFIEEFIPEGDDLFESYHCRSLATNKSKVIWMPDEIELHEEHNHE